MELEETLKQLNELSAEYIHEKTHISLYAVKAILEQNFTAIHSIQYAGFLKIIENELHIDMAPLRAALKEHNEQHNIGAEKEQLFIYSPATKANKKLLYTIAGVVVLFFILYLSFSSSDAEPEMVQSNSAISEATIALEETKEEPVAVETPVQEVIADSTVAQFNPVTVKDDVLNTDHPFIVYPKGDLWIGVVDLDTKTKKDTITDKPYALDENTNILISLGHGQVKIVLNGKTIDSDTTLPLRYIYKDGVLKKLTFSEFKDLNEGNSW